MAPILASRETSSDYIALRMQPTPFPGYGLLLGTSLDKVGHSINSNLYYNIGTQNRLITKVSNIEWPKNIKRVVSCRLCVNLAP